MSRGGKQSKMRNEKGQFIRGSKPPEFEEKRRIGMLGHVISQETRNKIGEANKISLIGNRPWNKGLVGVQKSWNKGIKNGNKKRLELIKNKKYRKLHTWVESKKGKPKKCCFCKKETGRFHWANISGLYLDNLSDWMELCVSCHFKYDNQKRKNENSD